MINYSIRYWRNASSNGLNDAVHLHFTYDNYTVEWHQQNYTVICFLKDMNSVYIICKQNIP